MFKIKTKLKAGFSLIEVMTALFIISLGLVGVLSLIVQSIQSQNLNKGLLIAYQLSQEGIELVRHTRDSNWAAGQAWNTNLAPLTPGSYYIIDYHAPFLPRVIDFPGQEYLKQDSLGFYYNPTSPNDSNKNSGFSRRIEIVTNPANPDHSIYVRAFITWSNNGKIFNYDLETTLYDWK